MNSKAVIISKITKDSDIGESMKELGVQHIVDPYEAGADAMVGLIKEYFI